MTQGGRWNLDEKRVPEDAPKKKKSEQPKSNAFPEKIRHNLDVKREKLDLDSDGPQGGSLLDSKFLAAFIVLIAIALIAYKKWG